MFRTMSIKSQLLLSGSISIVAILVLSVFSVYSLWVSEHELEAQVAATTASRHVLLADMMHDAVEASVLEAIVTGPDAAPEDKESTRAGLAEKTKTFNLEMSALKEMELDSEIRGLLTAALPKVELYLTSAKEVSEAALAGGSDVSTALDGFQAQSEALADTLGPLGDAIVDGARTTAATAIAHGLQLIYIMFGVSAALLAAAVFNAWKMIRNITRPMARLRAALAEVAGGNFGLEVAKGMRTDDFGEIARDIDAVSAQVVSSMEEQKSLHEQSEQVIARLRSGLQRLAGGDFSDRIAETFSGGYDPLRVNYNETVDKLNELISEVVQSGARIQQQSDEIRTASEDLSARTESQAATLEETAAALEEMTASVNSSARNAQEVQTAVETARGDVEHSGEVVQGAIAAMNEIENSSNQISQIIGVIDDIAFQTNLLALNAGVEAARAGEVGRGFAVVASEVRALAQRSSDAAMEIKTLISASSGHVQDGVQKVDGAGKALGQVVSQVSRIAELVSGISSEAAEQAQGLNEINIGVSQLDSVTQKNASMVEEASASIRVMNSETMGLNQLVGQFVLRGQGGGAAGQALEASPGSWDTAWDEKGSVPLARSA